MAKTVEDIPLYWKGLGFTAIEGHLMSLTDSSFKPACDTLIAGAPNRLIARVCYRPRGVGEAGSGKAAGAGLTRGAARTRPACRRALGAPLCRLGHLGPQRAYGVLCCQCIRVGAWVLHLVSVFHAERGRVCSRKIVLARALLALVRSAITAVAASTWTVGEAPRSNRAKLSGHIAMWRRPGRSGDPGRYSFRR